MRRTKADIQTVIYLHQEDPFLEYVVEQVSWFSDDIYICASHPNVVEVPDKIRQTVTKVAYTPAEGRWFRQHGYSLLDRGGRLDHINTVMFLESSHVISDPHIVRETIEYNPGKILLVHRFYLWDQDNYRNDGLYRPLQLPVIGPASYGLTWDSGHSTTPTAWDDATRHVHAPFNIQDLRYLDNSRRIDDGNPSLKRYEGKILA